MSEGNPSAQKCKHPSLNREQIIYKSINKIRSNKLTFRNVIRSYSKLIIKIRDELFNISNLDINKWLNMSYEISQYDELMLNIKKKIFNLQETF